MKKAVVIAVSIIIVIAMSIVLLFLKNQHDVIAPESPPQTSPIITIPPDQDVRIFLEPKNNSQQPGMVEITSEEGLLFPHLSIAGDLSHIKSIGLYKGTCESIGDHLFDLTDLLENSSVSFTRDQIVSNLPLAIQTTSSNPAIPIVNCGTIVERNIR